MNIKMKYMKRLNIVPVLLALLIVSCESDDKLVDDVQANVERGAIVRTISTEGTSWNVADDTETFSANLEFQDIEDGGLLQEVRFYVDLVDNTDDNIIDPAEALLETIPASEWVGDVWGLPRTDFSVSLAEAASALGISLGDYNCGDEFNIRLEIQLTDGRTITNTDLSGTVSGGSFFSSPLNYRIALIFLLPNETVYTGDYQLTTTITGTVLGGTDFVDGVYAIDFVDNVTRVIRSVPTLPEFGPFGPVDVQFSFVCDQIIMGTNTYGASCNGNLVTGPADVNDTFDVANPDDSSFILNFTADAADDCGTSGPGSVTMTKQ